MIYKTLTSVVHRISQEKLPAGVFITDDGEYNPEDGIQTIATGEAVINVSPAPPPILWRPNYLAGRSQDDINLMLGWQMIDRVDGMHPDYAQLLTLGLINKKSSKTIRLPKPSAEQTEDKT